MARILPAAAPTTTRTTPTMATGQLPTTIATLITKAASNTIATAVQAAVLWPSRCFVMGFFSSNGEMSALSGLRRPWDILPATGDVRKPETSVNLPQIWAQRWQWDPHLGKAGP